MNRASYLRGPEGGSVYLVGAGPGSPELLTVRAHGLIAAANCVLHDDLVSAEIIGLVRENCVVRNVGKRCGKKTITQDQINLWMVEYARAGLSVVRLKSGDPLLFGRAAEEVEALTAAGVAFEIVPGVSAGFAAAALAGIPLTGRITNSRVLFATRHLAQGETSGLTGIGPEVTLVLYMPGRDYATIREELRANGWPDNTRCVAASGVGTGSQRIASCRLDSLDMLPVLAAPVVMLFFPTESDAGAN